MDESYSDRENEFGQAWAGPEGDNIRKLFIHAGERIAALCLDEAAVDAAVGVLGHTIELTGYSRESGRSWRAVWSEADFDLTQLGQKLTSLHAYAFFGLSPKDRRGPCSIDDIKSAIALVKTAIGQPGEGRPDTPEIDRTILAAEGRLALDEGRPVALEQLAALAGLGMKSIRNAAAPSSGSGLEIKDGAATAESATNWLVARGDFKTSIWSRASEDDVFEVAVETFAEVEGDILWVPFASDGSEFDPMSCLRGGGYTIGRKGAEEKVDDYRAALDRLARMRPTAYWRRPNSAGNWGIVTAEGFRPRTERELGSASVGDAK